MTWAWIVFGVVAMFVLKAATQAMIENEYDEWAAPLAVRFAQLAGWLNRGFREEWLAELTYVQRVKGRPGLTLALSFLLGTPQIWAFGINRALFGEHSLDSAPKVQVLAKRLMDIMLSAVALVYLLPMIGLTAIAVSVSSGGPVLFRQTRVGRNGETFTLYRFRTMRRDDEEHGLRREQQSRFPLTRVGSFLHRFSFDELPQLWNVLAGDMSLVGPRPGIPFEVDRYDDRARQRLSVKPGMTGLWQVSGRESSTFDDSIDKDLEYIGSWTVWADVRLMIRTVAVVGFRRFTRDK